MDFWDVTSISNRLEQLEIAVDREANSLARWIWEDVLLQSPQTGKELSEEEGQLLDNAINRLHAGEPVQYIAGHAWFYGMKFKVGQDVLIPRPETEELVEWILLDFKKATSSPLRILDIGTGSGCIAITLKKYLGPQAEVIAIDISDAALQIARHNAKLNNEDITFLKVDFLENGFQNLGVFDLIVSNPPYVSKEIAGSILLNQLRYEPSLALFPPGTDPDIFYKKISREAATYLHPQGACYLELNEFRVKEIKALFSENGWEGLEARNDMQGLPRMLKVQKTFFVH